MAIKNPFKAGAKLPDVSTAPDWRKHPDLLAHQAQRESCRAKLPILARMLAEMEQAYHAAEDAYARCELLSRAGKPLPDGVASLDAARDALERAKTEYAIARVAHADCAQEHAGLEAGAQTLEETVRAEVAQRLSADHMRLLAAQKVAVEAAIEAQAAVEEHLRYIVDLYPGFESQDPAFHRGLGLELLPLPNLRKPTEYMASTAFTQWLATYERLGAEHEYMAGVIPPERR